VESFRVGLDMQTDTRIEPAPQVLPAASQDDHSHRGWTVQPISTEQYVRIGQEAWTRLSNCQSWNDWLLVGEAHLVGRTESMRVSHSNKPEGRRYNVEFSCWLKANKFDDIDKKTRGGKMVDCIRIRPPTSRGPQTKKPAGPKPPKKDGTAAKSSSRDDMADEIPFLGAAK
jgi:hypothetical protein